MNADQIEKDRAVFLEGETKKYIANSPNNASCPTFPENTYGMNRSLISQTATAPLR